MDSFEKISKMNLADLERPDTGHPGQDDVNGEMDANEQDLNPDSDADGAEKSPLTVGDVEGTPAAGTAGTDSVADTAKKERMREPEGEHYYFDAKITEKELLAFLFNHNYHQPLMLVAVAVAVIWPIMIIIREDSNMLLALALAALILVALPLSTWSRGRKAARTNPSYKQVFHYMVDEWGLHLELDDKCIDLEWNKVLKCYYLKSVTVIYTSKINAFLLPAEGMAEQREQINALIRRATKKK